MNIPQSPIRCLLAHSTVRRCSVVVYVGMFFDDLRKHTLVNVPCREVGLAEIRFLVRIVQLELERFGHLVVCTTGSGKVAHYKVVNPTFVVPGEDDDGGVVAQPLDILNCLLLDRFDEGIVCWILWHGSDLSA